jgi:nucleoside phosphorylase
VLLLSAFEPELRGFDAALGPTLSALSGGLRVTARAAGIGLVASAVGAALLIEQARPKAVVLVGTCGSYAGRGFGLFDVIVASHAVLLDAGVARGEAALPAPMTSRIEADPKLRTALEAAGARAAVVANTVGVTTSNELASRLSESAGAAVEHLEAFAVATACVAASAPFAAVLAVANTAGAAGRREWLAHHEDAGKRAAAVVLRWLAQGAAGVPTDR